MNATKLRATLQLLGVAMFIAGFWFLLLGVGKLINKKWYGVIPLLIWLYSMYIGYLAVMRFSPKSIQHILLLGCFWCFFIIRIPITYVKNLGQYSGPVQGLLSILLIVALVKFYRRARLSLVHAIFPPLPSTNPDSK